MTRNLNGLGYANKTVVVTGASSGMGEATAAILVELGANVHIVDIIEPQIACAGFYQTDLADHLSVNATINDIINKVSEIDFLFSCAGVPPTVGALKCMMINYIGNRQLVEGLLPMLSEGSGIAIIASDAAMGWQKHMNQSLELLKLSDPVEAKSWCEHHPEYLRDGYTSSKEMLLTWVQHSCIELGKSKGIRINCIGPGPTGTAFIPQMETSLDENYFANFPYPLLKRMATPQEQAWPLVLLNCSLNNVVTGACLWTDQGFASGVLTGALDPSAIMSRK